MDTTHLRSVLKRNFAIPEAVLDQLEEYLQKQNSQFTLGRTDFIKGIYANAQKYNTKTSARFEYHIEYVDVQIILCGKEMILFAENAETLEELVPYDPERDIAFAEGLDTDATELHAGEFCVIKSPRPHMPCMTVEGEEPSEVWKVVIKIHKSFLR